MKIGDLITEVKVFNKQELTEPLKDTDSIRVFHGARDLDTVVFAITHGLTGDQKANRTYSYENNNNPKGLFVTLDLNTAKEFGAYVIEFHTKVSDLEAPVWPSGMYTVQGGKESFFKSEEERENHRLQQRNKFKNDENENIRNSDRPELAATLFSLRERQALFVGDLNPNSIKAIWVSSDPAKIKQPYERLSIKEFLKMFQTSGIKTRFGSVQNTLNKELDLKHNAYMVTPREMISFEELVNRFVKDYGLEFDEAAEILVKNKDYIKKSLWSDRQYDNVINDPLFLKYKNSTK
jgi:hypothetical protein